MCIVTALLEGEKAAGMPCAPLQFWVACSDLRCSGKCQCARRWGYVEGEEVECPFHQGRFHIPSGTPTSLPCAVPIKTYPVTMRDGMVCIAA